MRSCAHVQGRGKLGMASRPSRDGSKGCKCKQLGEVERMDSDCNLI